MNVKHINTEQQLSNHCLRGDLKLKPRASLSLLLHIIPTCARRKGVLTFVYLFVSLLFLVTEENKMKRKNNSKRSEGECTAKAIADSAHHMGLYPQNKEQMKVSHFLLALITELTKLP